MMKTILLTGFEPFAQSDINPSWEVARALDGWRTEQFIVHSVQLPCVFGTAQQAMIHAIEQYRPDVVIALGQAGGRCEITPERIAINIDDARIPDNAGSQPIDIPVAAAGPAAYFSTLPIKAIVQNLSANGIPSAVSQSAGTFVCNHVFYGLMHYLATKQNPARAGFIHVPSLPEQAALHPGEASMALADMLHGLRLAIQTSCSQQQDIAVTGGQIH
ncbi:pyroglutamyl-peptidase I [Solimicrobium silvestre]|uniref:Pyrrolidone-carboxylate peptidase n=1 Tax=Solimicrobium silvestre TaxID=2099400 RepID=A0A2S9GVS9_9BURK|nr:pyroglutamyl-peptidase I [Solimicrobium silvestre]PRC91811.1 Pyroglutamyl-peptidase I [Solimicrobium silvestre]